MPSLRVVQVVSGLNASDGGPTYSVPRLNEALLRAGMESRVFADIEPGGDAPKSEEVRVFPRQYVDVLGLRKLHLSRALRNALRDERDRIDLIHNHGLWRMPNVYAGWAARRRRIPMIVSPRGMLSAAALQLSRRSKFVFWHAVQKRALAKLACFHATSVSEYEDIRRAGFAQPVAIVPNGVELREPQQPQAGDDRGAAGDEKTLLFLGRIHPIKGVESLVAAWIQVASEFPDWRLRIVGPSEPPYRLRILELIMRLGAPRVTIEDEVQGEAKWKLFEDATVFVQPSLSENFGLTVAESLSCGRPVIVTKGAPWAGVETNDCGWWIDTGEAAMSAAFRQVLKLPPETLDKMGERGKRWVERAFSWDIIGRQMAGVYQWLCHAGPRPDTVRTD